MVLEVDRPQLLRFSVVWIEGGRAGPETEVRVTFRADGAGTRLNFVQGGFAEVAERDGHSQGWRECLDRLAAAVDAAKVRA